MIKPTRKELILALVRSTAREYREQAKAKYDELKVFEQSSRGWREQRCNRLVLFCRHRHAKTVKAVEELAALGLKAEFLMINHGTDEQRFRIAVHGNIDLPVALTPAQVGADREMGEKIDDLVHQVDKLRREYDRLYKKSNAVAFSVDEDCSSILEDTLSRANTKLPEEAGVLIDRLREMVSAIL